jgi:pyruvate dehydrogenase E2 component (dihydrolipoamide acetyltransferase)
MAITDFVMPKLGLTMTEGTIARWDAAPGARFAKGDIILVVETDKIAYDVEAPAPGMLQEVLVAAGSAVPVGTPIGRWDVGDIKVSLDAPDPASTVDANPAAAPAAAKAPPAPAAQPRAEAARTLATPYARRLARQAGIDWRGLDGSGPRGRVKAADVERAIAQKRAAASAPSMAAAPAAEAAPAATFSAGAEIDITALLALAQEINKDWPDLHADLTHFVALSAAKVSGAFAEPRIFGLARQCGDGEGAAALVGGADCRTLTSLIANAKAPAATDAAPRGTLWIERALAGVSFLSADPPTGWTAALTIGDVREAFRPDADGRAVCAALVTVVLSARAGAVDPQQGQRLLREIRRLLEAPLLLLAT